MGVLVHSLLDLSFVPHPHLPTPSIFTCYHHVQLLLLLPLLIKTHDASFRHHQTHDVLGSECGQKACADTLFYFQSVVSRIALGVSSLVWNLRRVLFSLNMTIYTFYNCDNKHFLLCVMLDSCYTLVWEPPDIVFSWDKFLMHKQYIPWVLFYCAFLAKDIVFRFII